MRRPSNSATEALVKAALSGDDRDLRIIPNRSSGVVEIELTDFSKVYDDEDDSSYYCFMNEK